MGVRPIVSPTYMVWLLGRTQTGGEKGSAAVHALQDQYGLTPMSAWGTSYVPPAFVPVAPDIDAETPPPAQVAHMDAASFFGRLNALMKCNPPAAGDAKLVERFEAIGIAPGRPLDFASLDPVVAEALELSLPIAQAIIGTAARKPYGRSAPGWQMTPHWGTYGADYLRRAAMALGRKTLDGFWETPPPEQVQ